jgi:D-alanyl-D-alanine carboxypeptidase/D-alanyl-D-alanine-endopeptidase (penicillin-binding protein 4)
LTPDDALKFAREFRESTGLQADEVLLNDGSGLSRSNLVTPQAIVQWLGWAERQEWGADFRATLPVAGEDGTLETRMKDTAAAGRVAAKTGGLDHVAALSGYATSLRGTRVIFSLLGNSNAMSNGDATAILDAICVAMVEELGAEPVSTEPAPENHPEP